MPSFRVGARGLRVLRRDRTFIDYPPGQVVEFKELPDQFEGDLTLIPSHSQPENKQRRSLERKPEPGTDTPSIDFGRDTD